MVAVTKLFLAFCRDKTFVRTKLCLSPKKKRGGADKIFVTTNISGEKHVFIATKVLSRQPRVCRK